MRYAAPGRFRAIGVSGHTLKHVAAAAGMSLLVLAIQRRSENRGPGEGNIALRPDGAERRNA